MSMFGWSYPAGCSGPPDAPEPDPWSAEIGEMLANVEIEQDVIDRVVKIVSKLAAETLRACPVCEKAAVEREIEADKAAEEYWNQPQLPGNLSTPNFVDIDLYAPATQTTSELDLLRDQVDRLEAKRAYDARQMRHIRRILRAVDMPAQPVGTISRNAIASPSWQVLMLARAAMGLCAKVDRLKAELETCRAEVPA